MKERLREAEPGASRIWLKPSELVPVERAHADEANLVVAAAARVPQGQQ